MVHSSDQCKSQLRNRKGHARGDRLDRQEAFIIESHPLTLFGEDPLSQSESAPNSIATAKTSMSPVATSLLLRLMETVFQQPHLRHYTMLANQCLGVLMGRASLSEKISDMLILLREKHVDDVSDDVIALLADVDHWIKDGGADLPVLLKILAGNKVVPYELANPAKQLLALMGGMEQELPELERLWTRGSFFEFADHLARLDTLQNALPAAMHAVLLDIGALLGAGKIARDVNARWEQANFSFDDLANYLQKAAQNRLLGKVFSTEQLKNLDHGIALMQVLYAMRTSELNVEKVKAVLLPALSPYFQSDAFMILDELIDHIVSRDGAMSGIELLSLFRDEKFIKQLRLTTEHRLLVSQLGQWANFLLGMGSVAFTPASLKAMLLNPDTFERAPQAFKPTLTMLREHLIEVDGVIALFSLYRSDTLEWVDLLDRLQAILLLPSAQALFPQARVQTSDFLLLLRSLIQWRTSSSLPDFSRAFSNLTKLLGIGQFPEALLNNLKTFPSQWTEQLDWLMEQAKLANFKIPSAAVNVLEIVKMLPQRADLAAFDALLESPSVQALLPERLLQGARAFIRIARNVSTLASADTGGKAWIDALTQLFSDPAISHALHLSLPSDWQLVAGFLRGLRSWPVEQPLSQQMLWLLGQHEQLAMFPDLQAYLPSSENLQILHGLLKQTSMKNYQATAMNLAELAWNHPAQTALLVNEIVHRAWFSSSQSNYPALAKEAMASLIQLLKEHGAKEGRSWIERGRAVAAALRDSQNPLLRDLVSRMLGTVAAPLLNTVGLGIGVADEVGAIMKSDRLPDERLLRPFAVLEQLNAVWFGPHSWIHKNKLFGKLLETSEIGITMRLLTPAYISYQIYAVLSDHEGRPGALRKELHKCAASLRRELPADVIATYQFLIEMLPLLPDLRVLQRQAGERAPDESWFETVLRMGDSEVPEAARLRSMLESFLTQRLNDMALSALLPSLSQMSSALTAAKGNLKDAANYVYLHLPADPLRFPAADAAPMLCGSKTIEFWQTELLGKIHGVLGKQYGGLCYGITVALALNPNRATDILSMLETLGSDLEIRYKNNDIVGFAKAVVYITTLRVLHETQKNSSSTIIKSFNEPNNIEIRPNGQRILKDVVYTDTDAYATEITRELEVLKNTGNGDVKPYTLESEAYRVAMPDPVKKIHQAYKSSGTTTNINHAEAIQIADTLISWLKKPGYINGFKTSTDRSASDALLHEVAADLKQKALAVANGAQLAVDKDFFNLYEKYSEIVEMRLVSHIVYVEVSSSGYKWIDSNGKSEEFKTSAELKAFLKNNLANAFSVNKPKFGGFTLKEPNAGVPKIAAPADMDDIFEKLKNDHQWSDKLIALVKSIPPGDVNKIMAASSIDEVPLPASMLNELNALPLVSNFIFSGYVQTPGKVDAAYTHKISGTKKTIQMAKEPANWWLASENLMAVYEATTSEEAAFNLKLSRTQEAAQPILEDARILPKNAHHIKLSVKQGQTIVDYVVEGVAYRKELTNSERSRVFSRVIHVDGLGGVALLLYGWINDGVDFSDFSKGAGSVGTLIDTADLIHSTGLKTAISCFVKYYPRSEIGASASKFAEKLSSWLGKLGKASAALGGAISFYEAIGHAGSMVEHCGTNRERCIAVSVQFVGSAIQVGLAIAAVVSGNPITAIPAMVVMSIVLPVVNEMNNQESSLKAATDLLSYIEAEDKVPDPAQPNLGLNEKTAVAQAIVRKDKTQYKYFRNRIETAPGAGEGWSSIPNKFVMLKQSDTVAELPATDRVAIPLTPFYHLSFEMGNSLTSWRDDAEYRQLFAKAPHLRAVFFADDGLLKERSAITKLSSKYVPTVQDVVIDHASSITHSASLSKADEFVRLRYTLNTETASRIAIELPLLIPISVLSMHGAGLSVDLNAIRYLEGQRIVSKDSGLIFKAEPSSAACSMSTMEKQDFKTVVDHMLNSDFSNRFGPHSMVVEAEAIKAGQTDRNGLDALEVIAQAEIARQKQFFMSEILPKILEGLEIDQLPTYIPEKYPNSIASRYAIKRVCALVNSEMAWAINKVKEKFDLLTVGDSLTISLCATVVDNDEQKNKIDEIVTAVCNINNPFAAMYRPGSPSVKGFDKGLKALLDFLKTELALHILHGGKAEDAPAFSHADITSTTTDPIIATAKLRFTELYNNPPTKAVTKTVPFVVSRKSQPMLLEFDYQEHTYRVQWDPSKKFTAGAVSSSATRADTSIEYEGGTLSRQAGKISGRDKAGQPRNFASEQSQQLAKVWPILTDLAAARGAWQQLGNNIYFHSGEHDGPVVQLGDSSRIPNSFKVTGFDDYSQQRRIALSDGKVFLRQLDTQLLGSLVPAETSGPIIMDEVLRSSMALIYSKLITALINKRDGKLLSFHHEGVSYSWDVREGRLVLVAVVFGDMASPLLPIPQKGYLIFRSDKIMTYVGTHAGISYFYNNADSTKLFHSVALNAAGGELSEGQLPLSQFTLAIELNPAQINALGCSFDQFELIGGILTNVAGMTIEALSDTHARVSSLKRIKRAGSHGRYLYMNQDGNFLQIPAPYDIEPLQLQSESNGAYLLSSSNETHILSRVDSHLIISGERSQSEGGVGTVSMPLRDIRLDHRWMGPKRRLTLGGSLMINVVDDLAGRYTVALEQNAQVRLDLDWSVWDAVSAQKNGPLALFDLLHKKTGARLAFQAAQPGTQAGISKTSNTLLRTADEMQRYIIEQSKIEWASKLVYNSRTNILSDKTGSKEYGNGSVHDVDPEQNSVTVDTLPGDRLFAAALPFQVVNVLAHPGSTLNFAGSTAEGQKDVNVKFAGASETVELRFPRSWLEEYISSNDMLARVPRSADGAVILAFSEMNMRISLFAPDGNSFSSMSLVANGYTVSLKVTLSGRVMPILATAQRSGRRAVRSIGNEPGLWPCSSAPVSRLTWERNAQSKLTASEGGSSEQVAHNQLAAHSFIKSLKINGANANIEIEEEDKEESNALPDVAVTDDSGVSPHSGSAVTADLGVSNSPQRPATGDLNISRDFGAVSFATLSKSGRNVSFTGRYWRITDKFVSDHVRTERIYARCPLVAGQHHKLELPAGLRLNFSKAMAPSGLKNKIIVPAVDVALSIVFALGEGSAVQSSTLRITGLDNEIEFEGAESLLTQLQGLPMEATPTIVRSDGPVHFSTDGHVINNNDFNVVVPKRSGVLIHTKRSNTVHPWSPEGRGQRHKKAADDDMVWLFGQQWSRGDHLTIYLAHEDSTISHLQEDFSQINVEFRYWPDELLGQQVVLDKSGHLFAFEDGGEREYVYDAEAEPVMDTYNEAEITNDGSAVPWIIAGVSITAVAGIVGGVVWKKRKARNTASAALGDMEQGQLINNISTEPRYSARAPQTQRTAQFAQNYFGKITSVQGAEQRMPLLDVGNPSNVLIDAFRHHEPAGVFSILMGWQHSVEENLKSLEQQRRGARSGSGFDAMAASLVAASLDDMTLACADHLKNVFRAAEPEMMMELQDYIKGPFGARLYGLIDFAGNKMLESGIDSHAHIRMESWLDHLLAFSLGDANEVQWGSLKQVPSQFADPADLNDADREALRVLGLPVRVDKPNRRFAM